MAWLPIRENRSSKVQSGALVARILSGAWRDQPDPLKATGAQIGQASPQLLGSGAGALGWRRLTASPPFDRAVETEDLAKTARMLALADTLRAENLEHLAALMREAGIMPLLFKGWAIAQYYAETYLRPCGDYDILVKGADYHKASALLARHAVLVMGPGGPFALRNPAFKMDYTVDLHGHLSPLYSTDVNDLFRRAQPAPSPAQSMLVPCAEDHLRIVIIHLLKHGAWRPIWLCDVAALVEKIPDIFDWEICLTGDRVTADWIRAIIVTAHHLLDCRIDHLLEAVRCYSAPAWIEQTIRKLWNAPYPARFIMHRNELRRAPLAYLRKVWGNPIWAAFTQGAAVTKTPRIRYQLSRFSRHAGRAFRPWVWAGK